MRKLIEQNIHSIRDRSSQRVIFDHSANGDENDISVVRPVIGHFSADFAYPDLRTHTHASYISTRSKIIYSLGDPILRISSIFVK